MINKYSSNFKIHLLITFIIVFGLYDLKAVAQGILEVPRYVSLHKDEVNVRTGPGIRYPVKWVFVRKFMPVKVIANYDAWRKIRDWEGTEGWVHHAMLSSKRYVITVNGLNTLRKGSTEESRAVAKLGSGVVAEIQSCEPKWCKLLVGGYRGWMQRDVLWGLKPGEIL